jgi:cobyrinic acid a,c-diamide synthase
MSAPTAVECPALMVTAPSSGQGKTTVTAALAHGHRSAGRRVRVFKTGPDYLDPMVLERASGAPVQQLEADLILVEGVMGLHDGTPSSVDLALHFGLPVLAVIDATAMAQTFGAIAHGLATYRPGLKLAGVLANRVGSAGHAQMLRDSLLPGTAWYGALPRGQHFALPSRHLGLVQAGELGDIDQRLAAAAQALGVDGALPMPPTIALTAPPSGQPTPTTLAGVTIAVARDAAFSFLYPANLETLRALGAELCFFSPLADEPVPAAAHALYLPGGYPELHLQALANNTTARDTIRAHHAASRPLLAECGGMLALLESMTDAQGQRAAMLGLLPGHGVMADGLVNLGMHSLLLPEVPEGELRGHTFHHARIDGPMQPALQTQARRQHGRPEAVYRVGRLFASFMHLYFASNPAATAALFRP